MTESEPTFIPDFNNPEALEEMTQNIRLTGMLSRFQDATNPVFELTGDRQRMYAKHLRDIADVIDDHQDTIDALQE